MAGKPFVIGFVSFFGHDRVQRLINSNPIILNILTNRNITLIYSVTVVNKTKGFCTVRELPT